MTRECELAPHAAPKPVTLWLSLRLGQSNWLFEFAETEERAIVVGCLAHANVRVERRGVAPIHFHFEREGDAIQLVPAYGDAVIVNGSAVRGALTLRGGASCIEFAGLRLEVNFFAVESDLLLPVSSHITRNQARRAERYSLMLPDPLSATRVAFQPSVRTPGWLPKRAPKSGATRPRDDELACPTPAPRALRREELANEMRVFSGECLEFPSAREIGALADPRSVAIERREVLEINGEERQGRRRRISPSRLVAAARAWLAKCFRPRRVSLEGVTGAQSITRSER